MNNRTFVVGDVHGCHKTLCKLLYDELKIEATDSLYFLGDLIDRGPRVRETVDEIMKLQQKMICKVVRGNHEQMLLDSVTDVSSLSLWYWNGCEQTLASFGITHPSQFEKKYLDFFSSLPYYIELEKFVLVHGGLNFENENPFEDKEYMLWGRYEQVDTERIGGKRIIAGHTPTPLSQIYRSLNEFKIFLDGGCVYKNRASKEIGYLVALELNTMELHPVFNVDF